MPARVNRVDARRGPVDAAQLYHGLRRVVTVTSGEVDAMSSADSEQPIHPPTRPRPIASLDDLTADTFGTDEEVEEFVAFTYSERRRDVA